jgi:hypothetical protein
MMTRNDINAKALLIFTLILGLALVAGCGSDDDDPVTPVGGGQQTTNGTVTVFLDGTNVDFSANSLGTEGTEAGWRLIAGGDTAANTTILIALPDAEGTYTVDGIDDPSITMVYNSNVWSMEAGTIVITAASNTNLTGTFSGTFEDMMSNELIATNGVFNVPVLVDIN